jgi:hypothetical protein
MKKSLVVSLVLSLVVAGLVAPAEAGKKKKPKKVQRKVEYEYEMGSPGIPGLVGACLTVLTPDPASACVDIPTGGKDMYVSVKVDDTSGSTPYGILAQDTNADQPGFEIFADFCGELKDPVPITPGLALRVSLYVGPSDSCAGISSSGTITTTLSNLP